MIRHNSRRAAFCTLLPRKGGKWIARCSLNAPNLTLGSLDKDLKKNADGTVDLYFGPKPPAGQESNWIYTQAGKKWFPWFRVYGPEKAIFDKSFRLPDIEKVK